MKQGVQLPPLGVQLLQNRCPFGGQMDTYYTFFNSFFSPSRRRTAFFLFEHTVEIGAGREAALGRNHIIAIVWLLQNHLFGSLKTYLGKPETEGGIETREVFGKLRFRDIQRA